MIQEISRIAAVAAFLGALLGCAPPPPPSPETRALQHQYETGCRPQDAQGYEGNMPYCGHDGSPRN